MLHALLDALLHALLDAFFHTTAYTFVNKRLFYTDSVPETVVGFQLSTCESRFPDNRNRLLDQRIGQQVGRDRFRLLVDLRHETKPQDLHLLLAEGMRRELGQLDEHQVKAVDDPVGILLMDQTIIMVVIIQLGLENLIQQIQGIDRLQKLIIFSLIQLTHIRLGSVEQDTVLELFRPDHLHLHDKLPSELVMATDIHDAVLT